MRRFFIDIPSLEVEFITLPEEESKHIVRVLRMNLGDQLEIINGKGLVFQGEIDVIHPKGVRVRKLELIQFERKPYHIHVAIAPTKSNDRFEWFLEKATELGIDEITPILCDNAERKVINLERFERIIVAAMKQSKRVFSPQLNPLTKWTDFIKKHPGGLIAHCYDDLEKQVSFKTAFRAIVATQTVGNIPVLIGPEGDFSIKEVKFALENGYKAVTLGDTRLRTETAGLYACMNLRLFFEENT